MIVGFNTDLFLRRPMTGIANYCFEMIRAQQKGDGGIGYLGFTGLGWRPVDSAYLDGVASDHGKGAVIAARPTSVRAISDPALQWAARTASRIPVARQIYRSVRARRFAASRAEAKIKLDLFHAYNFQPYAGLSVPTLPVIYDLSFVRFPEAHPKERLRALESLPKTIAAAPLIQTISQFSKSEIVDVYGYPADRIFVAPPAASNIFRVLGDEATKRDLSTFDLRCGSYFLAVGTLEPRKNIKTLIIAYAQLSPEQRARHPLVIVGAEGWGQLELPARTARLIDDGSLRFVGSVSDAKLRSLYEGTSLLLFPSIYEGFGMPVVEALACGAPVAHSSNSSMDEISGDLAVRIAACDIDAWAGVICEFIGKRDDAQVQLRDRRVAQAKTYSWTRSAALTLDAYRQILGVRQP